MHELPPIAALICLVEAASAAVLLQNPSFESPDMSPWTRTAISGSRPWSRGSTSAPDGTWYVFTVDEASISQSIPPIPGSELIEFTFWVDRPATANLFVELAYQDGSSSGRINIDGATSSGWGKYNALPLIDPSRRLTALGIIKTGTGTARLDDVRLVAVPEAAAPSLCIPGLALLWKRRRRTPGSGSKRHCR